MQIQDRVVDSQGNMGTVVGFRQHPYQKDIQEAEIKFDKPQCYTYRAVSALHILTGPEPLERVLDQLFREATTAYEKAAQSGNEHALYVIGTQLDTLKTIAARVLNVQL